MIVSTGTLLVAGHFAEVVVSAHAYDLVGAAPPGTDLIYFAFGNYTTLGYGDVLPLPHWHLLGPMTALNGIMLKCLSSSGIGRNPMGSGLFHVARVADCSPLFPTAPKHSRRLHAT